MDHHQIAVFAIESDQNNYKKLNLVWALNNKQYYIGEDERKLSSYSESQKIYSLVLEDVFNNRDYLFQIQLNYSNHGTTLPSYLKHSQMLVLTDQNHRMMTLDLQIENIDRNETDNGNFDTASSSIVSESLLSIVRIGRKPAGFKFQLNRLQFNETDKVVKFFPLSESRASELPSVTGAFEASISDNSQLYWAVLSDNNLIAISTATAEICHSFELYSTANSHSVMAIAVGLPQTIYELHEQIQQRKLYLQLELTLMAIVIVSCCIVIFYRKTKGTKPKKI